MGLVLLLLATNSITSNNQGGELLPLPKDLKSLLEYGQAMSERNGWNLISLHVIFSIHFSLEFWDNYLEENFVLFESQPDNYGQIWIYCQVGC